MPKTVDNGEHLSLTARVSRADSAIGRLASKDLTGTRFWGLTYSTTQSNNVVIQGAAPKKRPRPRAGSFHDALAGCSLPKIPLGRGNRQSTGEQDV